jgi:hypothetical protein
MAGQALVLVTPCCPFADTTSICPPLSLQATHFQTTKRASAQRKELIRQSDALSYTQQAAALSSIAQRVSSDAVLSTTGAGPVVHNLRDSRRMAPQQQAPSSRPANSGNWYFNLALQSSML